MILSCDAESRDGYLRRSEEISASVRASMAEVLDGSSESDKEDAEDIDVASTSLLLRIPSPLPSTKSNVGVGGAVLLVELELSSHTCCGYLTWPSSIMCLNSPPCTGGMKFPQRPSIFPTTNLCMNCWVSCECSALISSVPSRPTRCKMAISPPGWNFIHESAFKTFPSSMIIFLPSAIWPSTSRLVHSLSFFAVVFIVVTSGTGRYDVRSRRPVEEAQHHELGRNSSAVKYWSQAYPIVVTVRAL